MFDHMMRRDPIGERERSTSPLQTRQHAA